MEFKTKQQRASKRARNLPSTSVVEENLRRILADSEPAIAQMVQHIDASGRDDVVLVIDSRDEDAAEWIKALPGYVPGNIAVLSMERETLAEVRRLDGYDDHELISVRHDDGRSTIFVVGGGGAAIVYQSRDGSPLNLN